MGVRIQLYAVDLAGLDELLDQSVGDLLWLYAERGLRRDPPDEMDELWWHDEQSRRHYCAYPGEPPYVWCSPHQEPVVLTREAIAEHSFLSKTVREHLARDESWGLMALLQAFSQCASYPFIRRITHGQRRWWIGSLLAYAEQAPSIAREEYEQFVLLWQKVLRVYDCGKPLPARPIALGDFDFPIIPTDDTDLWMGVWTKEEAKLMVTVLEQIQSQQPRFAVPPKWVGLASAGTDDEWNEWVYRMIEQVLVLRELNIKDLRVVSFIDY